MVGEGRVGPPLEIVEIELALKPNPLFSGPEALTFGGRIGGGIKEWPQPHPPAPLAAWLLVPAE